MKNCEKLFWSDDMNLWDCSHANHDDEDEKLWKRMIIFFWSDDMNLWEWEIGGKVKAAKLGEGTVDEGER